MRLALILSLAVNVFLVAAIGAGAVITRTGPDGPPPQERRQEGPDLDLFTRGDIEQLPEQYRMQVREAFGDRMPQAWDLFGKVHEARMEGYRLMGEDEFDEAAFRAATERVKHLKAESQDLLTDTLIDVVVTLPPEERKAMAERIIQRHEEAAERFRKRMERREEKRKKGERLPPREGMGPRPDGPPPGGPRPEGPPPEAPAPDDR